MGQDTIVTKRVLDIYIPLLWRRIFRVINGNWIDSGVYRDTYLDMYAVSSNLFFIGLLAHTNDTQCMSGLPDHFCIVTVRLDGYPTHFLHAHLLHFATDIVTSKGHVGERPASKLLHPHIKPIVIQLQTMSNGKSREREKERERDKETREQYWPRKHC
jgi:hypothetical protein